MKLRFGRKEFLTAGGAFEDAFVMQIVIVIGEGRFRALPAQNVILLASQNLFPFRICLLDLVGHSSWHLVCFFLRLTNAEHCEEHKQADD